VKRIVLAGLTGLFTISFYLAVTLQFVFKTATAVALFQWDASNALGAGAFEGGLATATLGLLMDVPVSVAWAAVFVLLVQRVAAARAHPAVAGTIFGVLVMVVMHWLVVPLGHAHLGPSAALPLLNELVAHTVFFGLPLALVASRYRQ
jgi:uncharacterized membrane protein YagU involved in acid resistance